LKIKKGHLIAISITVLAFGALLFSAFRTFGSYSMTVTEFKDRQASVGMSVDEFINTRQTIGEEEIELHGWIANGPVKTDSRQILLVTANQKGNLPIIFNGDMAGTLAPGTEVIVRGKDANGVFQASRIKTTKEVRIEGPLSPDAEVMYDVATRTTRFTIIDTKDVPGPKQSLAVTYTGAVPDTFFIDVKRVDVSMVAIGRMGPDGVFVASQILTKCASRYEAAATAPSGENP